MYSQNRRGSSRPQRWSTAPRSGGGNYGGGYGGGRGGGRKRNSFNPSMFVKKAEELVEDVYTPQHAFADFPFSEQLAHNIRVKGYTNPTPIQDQIIPAILDGRDVVGLANTGTGKTAAFLLPLLQAVVNNDQETVLIIAPTRELATQIDTEFRHFAHNLNIYSALCIGGVSFVPQMRDLRRNPHFVIATPGRLRDLAEQGYVRFENFTKIVLDEVDQMMDMGFVREIRAIIRELPQERQSLFFSATMAEKIKPIMNEFLRNPVMVSVKSRESAANIDQDVVPLKGRNKIEVLHNMLGEKEFEKVLIFVRTKHGTDKLWQSLSQLGHSAAAIHGNKTQSQRRKAIDLFKQNRARILLATDVASRGLDIPDVSHVINFDLPETYEDYIHRIGRTGRANKKGMALTFVD